MESSLVQRNKVRKKRVLRVRKHLKGSSQKPRLCVIKTNVHIHVQLIDDEKAITLASTSTNSKEFRDTEFCKKNKESARKLGFTIAKLAKEKNVEQVVFDRGVSKYHGVIAALADGAREAGLKF